MRLDAWVSESQYLDHLAPVWLALPAEVRGTLYALQSVRVPPGLGQDLPGLVRGSERPLGPDPVLVASWGDHQGVAPAPTVFLEHGAGQVYQDADNGCYSGGRGRERAVLFVVPSRRVAARNSARYPGTPNAIVGCPKLDRYHLGQRCGAAVARRAHNPEAVGSNPTTATTHGGVAGAGSGSAVGRQPGPVVCVSFHWNDATGGPPERRSAFQHYEPVLADLAATFPGAIGHAHPRWLNQLAWPLERAGLRVVEHFDDVVAQADLYACDNSSTLYEFATLDRPVVVLNAPWFRREVDYWPRFWACADVGLQVDEPGHLVERVGLALADTAPMRTNRLRAVHDVYAHLDGKASERAAAAIVRRLAELEEAGMSVSNPFESVPPSAAATPQQLPAPAYPDVPRLRAAGATDAEVNEAVRLWGQMSEEDRWKATDYYNSLTLDELAELIEEGRNEDAALTDSPTPPEGTVAEVRIWIGDDPDRARMALEAEHKRERVRSSVTGYAEEVIGG